MSKFEEYCYRYEYIKLQRDEGILQLTFHSKGKELLWGGRPHEEASYAFYEVARDREQDALPGEERDRADNGCDVDAPERRRARAEAADPRTQAARRIGWTV